MSWLKWAWRALRCPHNNVTLTHGEERLHTGHLYYCLDCDSRTNRPKTEG